MRKNLTVAVAIDLIATLLIGSTALADDPSTVTTTWSGDGDVNVTVDTGDVHGYMHTNGYGISGTLVATDSNNNPYSYGVDSYTGYLTASIDGAGYIETQTWRDTSKESMYGAPGQSSYSYVYVFDGTASIADRVTTNYAEMKNPSYSYQLPGGHNIVADADEYFMERKVWASDGDWADLKAGGGGQATLDNMCSEEHAGSLRFGWGCGCYTDANFSATGTGSFQLQASGGNSASTNMLTGVSGMTSFNVLANWTSSFSVADYAVTVD